MRAASHRTAPHRTVPCRAALRCAEPPADRRQPPAAGPCVRAFARSARCAVKR
ncbi:hypothetical protein M218_28315 [Burkholderia pseudomallei MSHR338]|nr:hypothetical protein M218_28315 [Burkholderia pseudomallei MSHR338]